MTTTPPGRLREKIRISLVSVLALSLVGAFASTASAQAPAAKAPFETRSADAGGIRLAYLTGGNGPPLILLHGYAETSRMWIPIMPQLTAKFRVVAPDLPGIGDSDIPAAGLDMKSAATSVHALVRSLGITKARVVGHDIGLMVAYAYAAMYPGETEKLVLMDAFLPGIGRWEAFYNDPRNWHFRFNGPTPEKLVQGRERTYFEHYWNDFAADGTRSIPEADRQSYTAAYARPGRMRAGWAYFVSFLQAAKDFKELSAKPLSMPVLAVGGDKASGAFLAEQIPLVAPDFRAVIIKSSGHWIMEEQPAQTTQALLGFL